MLRTFCVWANGFVSLYLMAETNSLRLVLDPRGRFGLFDNRSFLTSFCLSAEAKEEGRQGPVHLDELGLIPGAG